MNATTARKTLVCQTLSVIAYIITAQTGLFAESFEITAKTAPIVYAVNAPQPPTIESIVEDYDPNYSTLKSQDEFAAHALLLKDEPLVQEAMQRAKNADEFNYIATVKLGEYDFDRNGFPLLDNGSLPFGTAISVDLNNGNSPFNAYHIPASDRGPLDVRFLPVPLDYAQTLASKLRQSRLCVVRVTGSVYHVELDKWIYFCPKSMKVSLADGTFICQKPNLPPDVYRATVPSSNYSTSFLNAIASYGGKLYAIVYGHATTNGVGEIFDLSDYLGRVLITADSSRVSFFVTDQEKEIRAGDFAAAFFDAKNLSAIGTGSINYLGGVNYLQLPENGQVVPNVNQQSAKTAKNRQSTVLEHSQTPFEKLIASVQNAKSFPAQSAKLNFPYDKVWDAVLKRLNEQHEKIVKSDKETGVVETDITSHRVLVLGYSDKYVILLEKKNDTTTSMKFMLLRYELATDNSLVPVSSDNVNFKAQAFVKGVDQLLAKEK